MQTEAALIQPGVMAPGGVGGREEGGGGCSLVEEVPAATQEGLTFT